MRREISVVLIALLLIAEMFTLSACKSDTEKDIEAYDKSIKVAEQQRRDAEKELRDIQNYKYSRYILENMTP